MEHYLIKETLIPCSFEQLLEHKFQSVSVMTPAEYKTVSDRFSMNIDMDLDLKNVAYTKAVVNYDALTGTLNIPDHIHFSDDKFQMVFVLDETGIIFIDEDSYASDVVHEIMIKRKWKFPSLERFIYDFLEETIKDDIDLLAKLESDLSEIEDGIMKGNIAEYPMQLNDIRYELMDMHTHYEHLIDMSKEFEENENDFFDEENLRYFRLFVERVMRLQDTVDQEKDYIVQLRSLVSEQLSIRQNNIMTLLTVITTIFMPLTLIAGWYGMNFVYMPELKWVYGYPAVILVSVLIIVISLIWFKKKKWL